jgi:uncharacterized membrane protein
MANYTIIGGDGKQYGPISEDDLQKWIAEGRLNARSQAKPEGDAEFRTLSTFPEFADALKIQAAAPETYASSVISGDLLERDYELDIGGCVSSGWSLVKENFGTLFVPVLIYFLIEMAVGVLGKIPFIGSIFSIANLFITGPLMAGVFYIFIRAIRNESAELGTMFAGFRSGYWQLFLGYLVPALAYLACLLPFLVIYFIKVIPILSQLQHTNPNDMQNALPQIMPALKGVLWTSLPILFVCMIPVIYLTVNWQFTLPLIIDKKMSFWPAMKASWKMVHKHWWHLFGLVVVIGLLNIAGAVACCIGLLFTIPLGFAALMYAYETIFSAKKK